MRECRQQLRNSYTGILLVSVEIYHPSALFVKAFQGFQEPLGNMGTFAIFSAVPVPVFMFLSYRWSKYQVSPREPEASSHMRHSHEYVGSDP